MASTEEDCAQSEPSGAGAHPGSLRLRLRRARRDDLAELLRLEADFPGDRLSPRQFLHHLRSPAADLWTVAGPHGHLAGYLLMLWHRGRRDGRIYSLVVDARQRGHGVGKALLRWAMQRARTRGAAGLRLEVRQDNAAALALYAREGFAEVGTRPGYYQDGESARCLRWETERPRPEA